jgi:chromosome segregation ATPase
MKTLLLLLASAAIASAQFSTNTVEHQLSLLQNQLRQIQRDLKDAESDRAWAELQARQASQLQRDQGQVELVVSALEKKFTGGSGLDNFEVEWIKAAGFFGKTARDPIYSGFVPRLYALYYAEFERRKGAAK